MNFLKLLIHMVSKRKNQPKESVGSSISVPRQEALVRNWDAIVNMQRPALEYKPCVDCQRVYDHVFAVLKLDASESESGLDAVYSISCNKCKKVATGKTLLAAISKWRSLNR